MEAKLYWKQNLKLYDKRNLVCPDGTQAAGIFMSV